MQYKFLDSRKNLLDYIKKISASVSIDLESKGFTVIRNWPFDCTNKNLMQFVSLIGKPISYAEEGAMIIDIKPRQELDSKNTQSYYTSTKFELHTDMSYVDKPPTYMLLLCKRQDFYKQAVNYISTINSFIEYLSISSLNELYKPQFGFLPPKHYQGYGIRNASILSTSYLGTTHIRFRSDIISCSSTLAIQAIQELSKTLSKFSTPVILRTGDILILNNKTVLHSRSGFTPTYDDYDRHLKRVYISQLNPIIT